MKNFIKFANSVGWFSAIVVFLFDWITNPPGSVWIDENGCLHCESTIEF